VVVTKLDNSLFLNKQKGEDMELIYYVRNNKVLNVLEKKIEDGKCWVRVSKGKRVGMVVSNGYNSVGWSLCNKDDEFDREKGLQIARQREQKKDTLEKIPYCIKQHVERMLERSKKVKAFMQESK
jgi:hypothetical protein